MKTLAWLGRVSLVPAVGVGLLVWWVVAALGRHAYDMSAWAVLLLFAGLALSRATPRIAILALYGAFALQFLRVVCRFDQEGWIAYAAIPLAAIVFGATTAGHRRRVVGLLLPLGLLTGIFTNVPSLGQLDYHALTGQQVSPGSYWGFVDGVGIVNGTGWTWPPTFGTGEVLVGTVAWSAGAMLLDHDDPARVLARTDRPLLEPDTADERVGVVPNVVFPTAVESIDGAHFVFYGMADTAIGVARLDLPHQNAPQRTLRVPAGSPKELA